MGDTPQGDRQPSGGRAMRLAPLRPALAMVAVGVVVVSAGLLVGDERWRLVALILGGMAGAVGLLTIGYARIERNAPLRRPPWGD